MTASSLAASVGVVVVGFVGWPMTR